MTAYEKLDIRIRKPTNDEWNYMVKKLGTVDQFATLVFGTTYWKQVQQIRNKIYDKLARKQARYNGKKVPSVPDSVAESVVYKQNWAVENLGFGLYCTPTFNFVALDAAPFYRPAWSLEIYGRLAANKTYLNKGYMARPHWVICREAINVGDAYLLQWMDLLKTTEFRRHIRECNRLKKINKIINAATVGVPT